LSSTLNTPLKWVLICIFVLQKWQKKYNGFQDFKNITSYKTLKKLFLSSPHLKLQQVVNFINILSAYFCTKVLQAAFFYLHVTREKLPKRLSYEKGAHKMLMKLTQGWTTLL